MPKKLTKPRPRARFYPYLIPAFYKISSYLTVLEVIHSEKEPAYVSPRCKKLNLYSEGATTLKKLHSGVTLTLRTRASDGGSSPGLKPARGAVLGGAQRPGMERGMGTFGGCPGLLQRRQDRESVGQRSRARHQMGLQGHPGGVAPPDSIWEQTGGEFECVASLEGHENEVKSVAWNAGGNLLATCSRDKSVWIWEAQPGNEYECVSVLQGHSQDVKMVRWHPTRDLLVSASYDDTIKVWAEDGDEDDWRCVQTLSSAAQGHTSTVWGVAFDSTGDRMVSCSDDLTLKVWDTHTDPTTSMGAGAGAWKHVSTISGYHERTIFSVDWSRMNGLIASASGDDAIRIFADDEEPPSTTGQPTFSQVAKKEKAHSTDVNCVRWHPTDPRLLASASDDMCVKIWELRGRSESFPNGGSANGSKDVHL
ncbi:Transducin [Klebsormidium nitens]|uniref:Probable cytosolic iron-sulfur protein assembly protein CIAO1 homolog n=1 Tax=Klebsormidium nitens TaxID=105231 RepID=A0A1Y1HGV1_KLENI|nr:Transducin [Klebsormidium nitens]|eukprot:GAQ77650.1 Transducin [Klebsormidium nitens]